MDGGRKSKCIIFFPPKYFLSVSLCLYVCKTVCLSVVVPCVARQPCVCTLKWGWKKEGKHWVNGDRRSHALLHLIEHTSAPDEWVGLYHCDWLLILIVSLKVHSCTQQEAVSMFVQSVSLSYQKMNGNVSDWFSSSKTGLKSGWLLCLTTARENNKVCSLYSMHLCVFYMLYNTFIIKLI